ncbi:MAG: hypothetical protein JSR26_04015 [Proteobacteria bacterium]|nr:hypothetical protein [Pseudomonadota bacterium]
MADAIAIALVSAGSALLGAAVGQLGPLVQHWLAVRHARRSVLREKYEQVATKVGELEVCVALRSEARAHAADPDPSRALHRTANELHLLATLYFQELAPEMAACRAAALDVDVAKARGGVEQVKAATERFAQASANAMDRLREFASRYA